MHKALKQNASVACDFSFIAKSVVLSRSHTVTYMSGNISETVQD